MNLIVDVKNLIILGIIDLRYEAVLLFKYLHTYVYIYNLIQSCDLLYIYVPFRKHFAVKLCLRYISLKNMAFSANLTFVQLSRFWYLQVQCRLYDCYLGHYHTGVLKHIILDCGFFFPQRSEKCDIMGSIQNNSHISSETFKPCSSIIRHI